MMSEEFKAKDSLSGLYKVLQKLNACDEALDRYADESFVVNDDIFSDIQHSKDVDQSWAMWSLTVLGKRLEESLRHRCIDKIRTAMEAFIIYLDCDYLTAEEDKLLEEKFKGKLPRAEQELRDGIVRRKKTEAESG